MSEESSQKRDAGVTEEEVKRERGLKIDKRDRRVKRERKELKERDTKERTVKGERKLNRRQVERDGGKIIDPINEQKLSKERIDKR